MRTPFKRPIRKRLWIAGVAACLLAASGTVAIVGSIPPSYASIPDEDAPTQRAATQRGSEGARVGGPQANAALPQAAVSRRGVVESMRQIEPTGEVGPQELTIRLRDGGTIVLNEATRRSWQPGNRVIVIGGLNASAR